MSPGWQLVQSRLEPFLYQSPVYQAILVPRGFLGLGSRATEKNLVWAQHLQLSFEQWHTRAYACLQLGLREFTQSHGADKWGGKIQTQSPSPLWPRVASLVTCFGIAESHTTRQSAREGWKDDANPAGPGLIWAVPPGLGVEACQWLWWLV